MADQTVVSATNFVTALLIGRIGGTSELGVYTVVVSVFVLLTAVLDSLVGVPYTILSSRVTGERRREYRGNGAMMLLTLVVAIELGFVLSILVLPQEHRVIVIVMMIAIPGVLLRHFARRYAFGNLKPGEALTVDAGFASLQLFGVFLLAVNGSVTAGQAIGIVGGAGWLVGMGWLVAKGSELRPSRSAWRSDVEQHWRLGRWLLGSESVSAIGGYVAVWSLVWFLDEAAAGVFAACSIVMMIANPFVLGVSNVLTAQAANAFSSGGASELRRLILRAIGIYAVVMSGFAVLGCVLGATCVAWVYGQPTLIDQHNVICVLSLTALVGAIGVAAGCALKAVERVNLTLYATSSDVLLSVVLLVLLTPRFGLLGAASAGLAGMCVGTSLRLFMLWQTLSDLDTASNHVTVSEAHGH